MIYFNDGRYSFVISIEWNISVGGLWRYCKSYSFNCIELSLQLSYAGCCLFSSFTNRLSVLVTKRVFNLEVGSLLCFGSAVIFKVLYHG